MQVIADSNGVGVFLKPLRKATETVEGERGREIETERAREERVTKQSHSFRKHAILNIILSEKRSMSVL